MKKLQYIIAALILSSLGNVNAQLRANQTYNGAAIPASSAFLDASVTNTINNKDFGKGMIYPRADLSTMVLSNQGGLYNISNNPNRFDGMIVYNTATSGVAVSGSTDGTLSKGFWYYDNPTTNPTGGTWRPFTSGKENILTTETVTNRLVNNAQIYGRKGTFVASGTSTAPTSYPTGAITIPASPTAGVYNVTVYRVGTGTVYANGVYSYDISTGNLITGSPSMSVVYPAGTYDYVVEYTK